MSKRTHDDRKKMEDTSPFKIPSKEMILTRGRTVHMRRQLRHKNLSSKSTSTRTSVKSATKLSPKPVNRLPSTKTLQLDKNNTSPPSKVLAVDKTSTEKVKIIHEKLTNSASKVTLKPKLRKINAKPESTILNKRKSNCPQKRLIVNVPCKDDRVEKPAAPAMDKLIVPETKKGKTLKQRCLEDERVKRASLAEVIRLRERTETLTDDDLLEIVQCPSPVWWEEQSERLDKEPFIAEQPPDERDTPQKAENKLQPPAAVPLNVARIPDSDCDQEFVSKRSALENVLFGLKTKGVSKDNIIRKTNLDKADSPLKCKPNRNVDINADQPTPAANALRDVMLKKMHAHLPKIRGVTENCMRFIRIKPVQAKKVYSGNDSAELIPYKGVKEVDIIDLSDEDDEQKDTEKTDKTKHAGVITDEHEVLKDLENLQIPIDNQVCIVIDEEENESFLGISESSQTQTKSHKSINNMEMDSEYRKNILDHKRLNLHLEMKSESVQNLLGQNFTQERSKNKENVSAATEDKNEGKGVKRKCDDDLDKDPKRKCPDNDLVGESTEKSDAVNLYLGDDSEIDASLSDCDQMSDTNMQFVHEDQLLDETANTIDTGSKTNFLTKEVQSDSNDSNAANEISKKSESVISKIKQVYRELITNMKNKNTGNNQTPFELPLKQQEKNKAQELDTENVNATELELDCEPNDKRKNLNANKIEELQVKTQGFQVKIEELWNKTEELQDKPEELQDKAEELQDQTEELQDKPIELQDEPEELQHESEKLQDQVEESQDQVEELQDQTEELQDKPDESQEQIEELQNKPEKFQEKPDELQDQTEELKDTPEELQDQAEETHDKTEELQDQTKRTKNKTAELQDKTEILQDRTEELQETQEVVIVLENITENELKEVNLADISQAKNATVHVFTDADLESGPITYEFVTSENEILKSLEDTTVKVNIDVTDKTASVGIKGCYFEQDEPDDEEEYKDISQIQMTKEMIENIIGVENRKVFNYMIERPKEVTTPETLEQIVLHGVSPLIAGKKDIVIAQKENLKYCYKCSSLYDTDKCSYCKYGTISSPFSLCDNFFNCNQCPYRTKMQQNIHNHVMKHRKIRPFSCDVCKLTFKTKFAINKHLEQYCKGPDKSNSKRPREWNITCDVCNLTFKTKFAITKHLEQYCKGPGQSNIKGPGKWNIKGPGKWNIKGPDKSNIEGPDKLNINDPGKWNVSCDVCNKTFKVKSTLRKHIEQDCKGPGIYKFSCDTCNRTFQGKTSMKTHLRWYCKKSTMTHTKSTDRNLRVRKAVDNQKQILDETSGYFVTY